MRFLVLTGLIVALLQFVTSSDLLAREELQYEPLMISRDSNGKPNKESKVALHRLSTIAQRNGHVVVWITLSSTYLPAYVGQLTEEQLAIQSAQVIEQFNAILAPLLQSSHIAHPRGTLFLNGPSCLIRTDKHGLKALVDDSRIGQIVGRL